MKIIIVGAGLTGLSSAYFLTKNKQSVIILESENGPGGMVRSFKRKGWKVYLEEVYHHLFTNDDFILSIFKELKIPIHKCSPRIDILADNRKYRFDNPISVLMFNNLLFLDRFRLGMVTFLLKIFPTHEVFEGKKALSWLNKYMGKSATNVIWKPVLQKKFGKFAKNISMSWLWARIKKRTANLIYPLGGFYLFNKRLTEKIQQNGGSIIYNSAVTKIISKKQHVEVFCGDKKYTADKVIVTLPSSVFTEITPKISKTYKEKLLKVKHLQAQTLVLVFKKEFLINTYWLNVNDKDIPFLVLVEHTNFIKPSVYNKEHILYVGNYLPSESKLLTYTKERLINEFAPYLKKINKNFKKNLIDSYLFNIPFAQPIVDINYHKYLPQIKTPINNVYLANMDMIYPWDRGTNYSVELGKKVADLINNDY